tara:strand:+ start:1115 stop:1402 length:288 start_codon:yes stop_codon:yes gene_type:complete
MNPKRKEQKHGWYTPKSKKQYVYKHVNGSEVYVSTVTNGYYNPYETKMNHYKGTEIYVGEVTKFIRSFENNKTSKLFDKFDFNLIDKLKNKNESK